MQFGAHFVCMYVYISYMYTYVYMYTYISLSAYDRKAFFTEFPISCYRSSDQMNASPTHPHTPLDETVFESQITLLPLWQLKRSHIKTMYIDENKLCLLTLEPQVMYTTQTVSPSARYKVTCVVTNLNYLNSPPHKFSTYVNLDYYTHKVGNTLIS